MSERQDDKSFTEKAGVAPKTLAITCTFSASLLSSWTTWNWLMSTFSSPMLCIVLPFSIVIAGGTNLSPGALPPLTPPSLLRLLLHSSCPPPCSILAGFTQFSVIAELSALTLLTEDSTIISTNSQHSFPFKDLTGLTLTRMHLAMFLKNKQLFAVTELSRNTHWLSLFGDVTKSSGSFPAMESLHIYHLMACSFLLFLHGTLVQAQLQMFCACDVGYCSHLFGITAAALIWWWHTTTAIIYFIFLFPSWWWGHTVIMIM